MPRAKRQRPVHLTKVKKATAARKDALIERLQTAVGEYAHVFVFAVHNMRTEKMNRLRDMFRDTSRFFLGKNKVMAVALGRTPETEAAPGIAPVGEHLVGNCGLLLTNETPERVREFFDEFAERDYARGAGGLPQFAHTMDTPLRKLGVPCMLKRGVITLERDFTVCEEGKTLTPDQAQILKLCDIKMASFAFTLTCHFDIKEQKFERLADPEQAQRLALRGQAGATLDADMADADADVDDKKAAKKK